jgi:hypothetical protein
VKVAEKSEQIAHIVIDAYRDAGINTDGVNIQTLIYFIDVAFGKEAKDAVMTALRDCVIKKILDHEEVA